MNGGRVTFYAELRDETDRAYLFHDGVEGIWIPRSQVKRMRKIRGIDYEIEVPKWLAKEKGIV